LDHFYGAQSSFQSNNNNGSHSSTNTTISDPSNMTTDSNINETTITEQFLSVNDSMASDINNDTSQSRNEKDNNHTYASQDQSIQSNPIVQSLNRWRRRVNVALNDTSLVVFSQEKGLLYLTKDMKDRLNITRMDVTIEPWNFDCFLNRSINFNLLYRTIQLPFIGSNRELQRYFHLFVGLTVGYDTIFVNELMRYSNSTGVAYSQLYDELYHLGFMKETFDREYSMNTFVWLLFKLARSPLLLYVMTFLITYYLLRRTQQNILLFAIQSQQVLWSVYSGHLSAARMVRVISKNVFQNFLFIPLILGFIGFISMYYQDRFTAVAVLSIIWLFQTFMMFGVTSASKSILPWIFHFYMVMYIHYTIRYPFGFTYFISLVITCLVLHSILLFWNKFEYFRVQRTHPLLTGVNAPGLQPVVGQASQFTIRFHPAAAQSINVNVGGMGRNVQIQLRVQQPQQNRSNEIQPTTATTDTGSE